MDKEAIIDQAIWVAHTLFARNKVTGSTANLSFYIDDLLYITSSGSCFGTLSREDFSVLDIGGNLLSGRKPSKELPLHLIMYRNKPEVKAVVHTHSFYSTLWSMEPAAKESDCVPPLTPYLQMKVGSVGLVPYALPGTQQLFDAFAEVVDLSDGFILKNHGPVIGGKTIMDAFYGVEEIEEACKLAWHVKHFMG